MDHFMALIPAFSFTNQVIQIVPLQAGNKIFEIAMRKLYKKSTYLFTYSFKGN